jgi:hypothetical protein
MKVSAWRDEQDIQDALFLLKRLAFADAQDVWSVIGGFIPAGRRGRAEHNFETLVELFRESA